MEIIDIQTFEENYIEVLFDGLFQEGFYVKTEFDYDIEVVQEEELAVACKEIKAARNITFFDFKIFNAANEEITINKRETKKIMLMVEFKIIDLLDEEINN